MIYKSCDWISGGLDFRQNSIVLCCFTYMQGYDEYELSSDYHGEKINWNELFRKKHELIERQKNNNPADFCKNCIYLEERDWVDDDSINCMIFNHWTNCNSSCIYCYFGQNHNYYNTQKYYDIVPILEDMEANGILKVIQSSFVSFGGGEPTLLKDFDKIINILKRNRFPKIRINSSGIKYSETLSAGLEDSSLNVCISPDAGTREKYKQIKQVDCFEKVWQNIGSYVQRAADKNDVKIKYIIIPEVNDSQKDIDDFFNMAEKYKVKAVCVSVDKNWSANLNEQFDKTKEQYIYDLMKYFEKQAAGKNLDFDMYSEGLSFKNYMEQKYNK